MCYYDNNDSDNHLTDQGPSFYYTVWLDGQLREGVFVLLTDI